MLTSLQKHGTVRECTFGGFAPHAMGRGKATATKDAKHSCVEGHQARGTFATWRPTWRIDVLLYSMTIGTPTAKISRDDRPPPTGKGSSTTSASSTRPENSFSPSLVVEAVP